MEKQKTFTEIEYESRKRVSRREIFLKKMDELLPWQELVEVIRSYYYNGKQGRPPKGIETMLRMYLLQNWYNLADEMAEEEIYDSYAMKQFMKINYQDEDATTLLKFRRLLEKNRLQQKIFERINEILEREGMMMRGGSIVDATFIDAPTSTSVP